jgi:CHAT domain-containing protein/Tfp pilus assembly protein PilF
LAIALSGSASGRTLERQAQQSSQTRRDAGAKADDEKEARLLESGKPIKRELAGDHSHTYQVRLSAGQFLRVIVEQQGIDVVAEVSGPDEKQILKFDSESRPQGREEISLVAEASGAFQLIVRPEQNGAPSGSYEIRIEELRVATDADRAVHDARKQFEEALKLVDAAKYDEALPVAKRAVEIRERLLGTEHHDVAAAINSLARIYNGKGEYIKAEPLYRRALAIREKALGKDHPDTGASLNNLAGLYREQGKYAEAEPLFKRALDIWEKTLGKDHPSTSESLNSLAVLYNSQGKYEEAEPLYKRALDIRERALGKDHPSTAVSLNNLAVHYWEMGKYEEAELLYKRALDIRERALGKDHPSTTLSLNNMAVLYYDQAKYGEAEPLYKRALDSREKSLGKDHPRTGESLDALAVLYSSQGRYVEAEPLFKRGLDIRERVLGKDHPDTARSLHNLAGLYRDQGKYLEAEPLLKRALDIWEKTLGKDHPNIGASLNNLAALYRAQGKYVEAEPLYKRALDIRERALGKDHPSTANSLNNLAELYKTQMKYAEAEPLYKRALAISEKATGKDHPNTGACLNNLATLYRETGKYVEAEPLYKRALDIREKALGHDHPDTAASLNGLAALYMSKGDLVQAVAVQARANSISERNIAFNLAKGSERQKLAYLALFSKQTDFTLSLHSQAAPHDPQALDLAFTTLLRRKGRGLDVMADTLSALRRRAAPEDQALFDRLAGARSRLAALTLRGLGKDKPETYRARLELIEEEVEKLEAELSSHGAEFRTQPVTLAAVQGALSTGSALVEFAVFTPRKPRIRKSERPRYLAYLLPAQGHPRWVDLGGAAAIDRAIGAWRKALRDPNRTDVERLARAVDDKIMRPVRSLLAEAPGETRRLLIAPDGSLNLIPFAALVDKRKRYLVERYSISYLTSGQDLLRLQISPPSKSSPLIMANPVFGRVETIAGRARQNPENSQAGDQVWGEIDPTVVFFQPLPGTEREALAIKAALPESSVLLKGEATETALKQLKAPLILHVATHGFFFKDQEAPQTGGRGVSEDDLPRLLAQLSRRAVKIENPLLRSGLALAGANEHRSGDDDGVLTALETASLNLWGTKLVVFSACDTGVGEVKNGEGVFGLRRALVLAGSETQVMTLWPVLDNKTGRLMAGYYRRLLKGEGRGEALRQIQLEMLKDPKQRHPYYWASFIQAGEWANLDGRR